MRKDVTSLLIPQFRYCTEFRPLWRFKGSDRPWQRNLGKCLGRAQEVPNPYKSLGCTCLTLLNARIGNDTKTMIDHEVTSH